MSVPAGYKATEVGVIPEDWEAVPLGDLFTFKNGLNKAKQYFGYGTPIVNYMDVYRYPALRMPIVAGRVDVNKAELDSYSVQKGDVFFTRTSETVDEIGVASALLDEANDTVFSGFVLRARPKNADLADAFKAYAFRSEAVRQQIVSKATYTTRALTNGGALSAVFLAKPPMAEQSAIAEALSDVDRGIAALEAVIAKKRALKTATMQALLSGTRRLPGFLGDWEVATLGDFGIFKGGSGFPLKYQGKSSGDYPFYKVSDMNNDGNSMYKSVANHWVCEDERKAMCAWVVPKRSITFAKIGAAIFLERKRMLSRDCIIDNNVMAFVLTRDDAGYPILLLFVFDR